MALPDNRLSTETVLGAYTDSFYLGTPLKSIEWGGVALNDASQGIRVKPWTIEYIKQSGDVVVSADGVPTTVLFNRSGITQVSLAFDRNMNPAVAFVQNGQAKLWWYDTLVSSMVFWETQLGAAKTPRVTHDDKRDNESGVSDVICAYVIGESLRYRQQRDRYLTERTLKPSGVRALYHIGMNAKLRLQFMCEMMGTPNPPFLADVVSDLCRRGGLNPYDIDVDELYNDVVYGLKVDTKEGMNTVLAPVLRAFRVDATEFDRQLHFYKRGRSPVVRITWEDLALDGRSSMEMTRVQEDKLPRRVNVTHLDPNGGYAQNKQYAHRKSNMVNAKSESTFDTGFVLSADQAAELAMILLKQPWYEQMSYKFSLPMKYAYLTPADTFEYVDKDGTVHVIRLDERNTADGLIRGKGTQDGGEIAYQAKVTGLPLDPPKSTTPGLIGETILEIINTSPWLDVNDKVGLHIAVAGASSGWYGCDLYGSTDGGVSYQFMTRVETPGTLGETTTALVDESDPLYSANQSVTVKSNFALESSPDNEYRMVLIGDELMYYSNVIPLGGGLYRLTDLVRGRYNTEVEAWPTGSRFVFIDSSVIFVELPRWTIGTELNIKPVSLGLTEDETIPTAYDFDPCYSQLEWAPVNVTATRDGSDNVTVDFIGRSRFGVETNTYDGQYFQGYRIKFSDGFTHDTTDQTYTRASTPPSVTIQVCGLNEITGEGQLSAGVTV